MSRTAKAFIIGAVAILSASAAVAQEAESVTFRYSPARSVEANYEAFKLTAARACSDVSTLGKVNAQRECRDRLVAQAVAATQVSGFIAYYQRSMGAVQVALATR